jgi:hypothetical protein
MSALLVFAAGLLIGAGVATLACVLWAYRAMQP